MLSDESTLSSTVADPYVMANKINNDLHNISTWAHQWKMNFNPDASKQAQKFIFRCKVKAAAHPELVFENNPVHETATQKHLEVFFDFKLNFSENFENMHNRFYTTIGILQKIQNTPPRSSLLIISKPFIRPYLDYGDIIYDQANNAYNVALAILYVDYLQRN